MFKTNTAREIFYIFLWLAGLILLYTLVFTFILEPSSGSNTATHAKHAIANDTHQEMKKVANTHTTPEAKEHVVKTIASPKTVSTPTAVAKVTHTVDALAAHQKTVVNTTETVKVPAKKNSEESVKKEAKASTVVPVAKSIEKKSAHTQEKVEKGTQTSASSKALSTPSVPKAVPMPTHTISIPSTPSVPSVPTIPNSSKKVEEVQVKTNPTEVKEVKEVIEQKQEAMEHLIKELEKVLSSDEEMKLIETARQHVIDNAEASRDEAMKALQR